VHGVSDAIADPRVDTAGAVVERPLDAIRIGSATSETERELWAQDHEGDHP